VRTFLLSLVVGVSFLSDYLSFFCILYRLLFARLWIAEVYAQALVFLEVVLGKRLGDVVRQRGLRNGGSGKDGDEAGEVHC
jgi:hypothetical protein